MKIKNLVSMAVAGLLAAASSSCSYSTTTGADGSKTSTWKTDSKAAGVVAGAVVRGVIVSQTRRVNRDK